MSMLNQKGAAPLLVILLLVAGVVGGTLLVKNPTFFNPQAAPSCSGLLSRANPNGCPPAPGKLKVSCSGTPNPAMVGQTVTWVAKVSGSSGKYKYQWSGATSSNDNLNIAATLIQAPYYHDPAQDAVQVAGVMVKDLSTGNVGSGECSVKTPDRATSPYLTPYYAPSPGAR
jgi:hypothetical protein